MKFCKREIDRHFAVICYPFISYVLLTFSELKHAIGTPATFLAKLTMFLSKIDPIDNLFSWTTKYIVKLKRIDLKREKNYNILFV